MVLHDNNQYNLYKHEQWAKIYLKLYKEINDNLSLSPLKSDYYKMQIKTLRETYSKKYQSKRLNLLELIVCSKELIPQKKAL